MVRYPPKSTLDSFADLPKAPRQGSPKDTLSYAHLSGMGTVSHIGCRYTYKILRSDEVAPEEAFVLYHGLR